MDFPKPLPTPSPDSRPFWEAARRHQVQLQYCRGCRSFIYYPRHVCPRCLKSDLDWREVSGKGSVYSCTVVRRTNNRAFLGDLPYVLAIVELDEGPRLTTNIVGCAPEGVHCGMPVEVCFDDVTPDVTLVKFRPLS